MKKRQVWILAVTALTILTAGCAIPRPPLPTDPGNPLKLVAVLPLKNDTTDVDGPEVVREKMVQALKNRSYAVMDIKESDQVLRDRMGITLGGQLEMTTPQKLGETLNVQGVLFGTLMDFDETTTGVYNVKKVRAKFSMVNTGTGQPLWQRGLGVKTEVKTSSIIGTALAAGSSVADAREKEAPWVLLSSTTTNQSFRDSLITGLGTKLLSKAVGRHLTHESSELARLITDDLPWGPGVTAPPAAFPASPVVAMPEIKTPAPPSFGYMEWEGKRDFHAIVHSVTLNKGNNQTWVMDAPLWITKPNMKMEMDLTRMMQSAGVGDAEQSPLSRMTMLNRGDKKLSYTLYPTVKKYLVHTEEDEQDDMPKVEKVKVGSETIDGHPCDKYRVRITYKNEKPQQGFIWNARDLGGMTIRSEVENEDFRVTTELKKIVLKSSPRSVFEIPQGFTEAKNFLELMMPGQQESK